MDVRGPSIPFNIAKAYAAAAAPTRRAPSAGAAGELIAARVPGKIDFASPGAAPAAPTGPALPMYRHPADKNAAATGVEAGRVIDVSG